MDAARRLSLGQVFTPEAVADLALALARPPPSMRGKILDPACGDGVFLARARAAGLAASRLAGVEIDPGAARAARARVPGVEIACRDLFSVAPDPRGYAAVIGNPPYVRQERLSSERKARVRRRLAADFPELTPGALDRLLGRGDLAAACIARAVRLARPGARISLVVSSALLDAGYARELWRVLARYARVVALIEAPRERWFADAAVNAMLLVMERASAKGPPPAPVVIARLSRPTSEAARRVRRLEDLGEVAEVRRAPPESPERWASILRADPVWFELEAAVGKRLVPLADLAEVRRGVTSGANDVFYLERARARELGIEPAALAPLVRSPRERGAETIEVAPDRTSHVALVCPPDPAAVRRLPVARRYLESHASAASRPTLRARHPWWALPVRPARIFLTKAYAARFLQRVSSRPVVADQRLYSLHPRAGVEVELLAAALNSTFTAFALESLGRASLGEGALEWTVGGAASLPVLDPRTLSGRAAGEAGRAFEALSRRPIGSVSEERDRRDRRALDRALAGKALRDLLPRIHDALIESVARRSARARSGME